MADQAGLRNGDRVLCINDVRVEGLKHEEVELMIVKSL